ncbi:hypothetical protein C8R45DRAFT_1017942 [Mycena sanguinolenta]|nr:hypothetical protein C8R45DRAFT_1017942 [Mycena sanguinolenta]
MYDVVIIDEFDSIFPTGFHQEPANSAAMQITYTSPLWTSTTTAIAPQEGPTARVCNVEFPPASRMALVESELASVAFIETPLCRNWPVNQGPTGKSFIPDFEDNEVALHYSSYSPFRPTVYRSSRRTYFAFHFLELDGGKYNDRNFDNLVSRAFSLHCILDLAPNRLDAVKVPTCASISISAYPPNRNTFLLRPLQVGEHNPPMTALS